MKKYLILLLSVIAFSCHQELTSAEEKNKLIDLSIPVTCSNSRLVTRSAEGPIIKDINFFIYNDTGSVFHEYYNDQSVINIKLYPDIYRCYVVANYGEKIIVTSEELLKEMSEEFPWDDLEFLYTAAEVIDLSNENDRTAIKPITVKRAGAFVDYNITVAPDLAGLSIETVRVCNIPVLTGLFQDDQINYYEDTEWDEVKVMNTRFVGASLWMPENNCGMNASIRNQRDKSEKNALPNSTFIHIKTRFEGSIHYFRVYLGENNTTDFNVRRNTYHKLDITIRDLSTVDTRMSHSIIKLENLSGESYFLPGETNSYSVTAICTGEDLGYRAYLEVLNGDYQNFTYNGRRLNLIEEITLGKSATNFSLGRTGNTLSSSNYRLDFKIKVIDKYGSVKEETFVLGYGFAVDILTFMAGEQSNLGTYTIDTPLAKKRTTLSWDLVRERHIYPPYTQVKVNAVPRPGNNFEGWYYNQFFDTLIQMHNAIVLTTRASVLTVCPKFTTEYI